MGLIQEIFADKNLEFQIENFTLVPSKGGVFEFSVNDELIYSKLETGRHAEPGEVIGLLRTHMAEAE